MLTLHTRVESSDAVVRVDDVLLLPFSMREKSRQRATLESGEEVALFMVRGTVLRHGDLLRGNSGGGGVRVVRIVAAEEPTYRVACESADALLRCAFHLGNRHTQTQVAHDTKGAFLRIRNDPVLREMLQGLGAVASAEMAAFEPEAGAYGGGHHRADGTGHSLAPVPLRQKIHRPPGYGDELPETLVR